MQAIRRIRSRLLRPIASLLLTVTAGSALAAHPFVSDDTGTQGRGGQQVELNTDRERRENARPHVAAATYSYGLQDTLDVFLNVPVGIASPSGMGNVSLGAKWRFLESESGSLALKPEFLWRSRSEAKGLGAGRASMALALLGTCEAAPWTFVGNLAFALNRYEDPAIAAANRSVVWRLSGGFSYHATPELALVGDIGVARDSDSATRIHPAFALTGLIYSPVKNLDLDIGLKFGLNRAEADRQFGVGLTFRF